MRRCATLGVPFSHLVSITAVSRRHFTREMDRAGRHLLRLRSNGCTVGHKACCEKARQRKIALLMLQPEGMNDVPAAPPPPLLMELPARESDLNFVGYAVWRSYDRATLARVDGTAERRYL
jgi:hypothetical protein